VYDKKKLHTECGSVNSLTTFGKLMRSGLESYINNHTLAYLLHDFYHADNRTTENT